MVLLWTVKHGMGYVRSETYFAIFYFCRNYNTKHNGALVLNTGIENRTEEIAASQNYTNIRFFRVGKLTSDKQENDLIGERDGWTEWASPATDDGDMLMDFSAICFLYARGISDHLGNKPLGLIASAYAGTHIEAWSPPETLKSCDIDNYIDEKHDYNSNSYLYNAMVHPFHKMCLKGVLWYQGESNSFWNTEKYKCMLQNMFFDWRNRWSQNSNTDNNFPIGVVTLGPFANPPTQEITRKDVGDYFPLIRWHQTFDYGFLPNSVEENGFMAIAMDTYYNGTEHPHNKQLTAYRLAVAGLSIAYQMSQFPSRGPFPTEIKFIDMNDDGNIYIEVTYDEDPISYIPEENSGFFYCCGENNSSTCQGDNVVPASDWKVLDFDNVMQTATNQITVNVALCNGPSSLGYLWAESPVTITHGLPIYSSNQYGLPAAPWWYPLY